ncbi:MAG: hypothetical protein KDC80_23190 [Saprospiraceae bacterium]|nr:hypothetical protein [Saprospiraceae bacterium]
MPKIQCVLFFSLIPFLSLSQEPPDFRDFPIVVTIQFQSLSMPFRNIKGHFRNLGIGIGTEFRYHRKNQWVQHLDLMWFRNKTMGNGLIISSQSGWRPYVSDPLYSEIKLGVAYFYNFRPADSYQPIDGKWVHVGRRGKGIFAIPTGITLGLYLDRREHSFSPFVGYQFMLTTNYAKSLPVTPWSFLQVGTRFRP